VRRIPVERLAAAGALVVLAILGGDLRADVLTAIVVVILVAALALERIYRWPRVEIAS